MSGSYIEMEPTRGNNGETIRQFQGLDTPTIVQAGTSGSSFKLHAEQVRSLSRGSPIYYRGISVGQVERYAIAGSGAWINVYIFIKAPYDKLVHSESRFWNLDAVAISAVPQV